MALGDGRVLDLHSTGSEFLGHEFGREQFDTRRTEVGELLYRPKYRNDGEGLGAGRTAPSVFHLRP